MGKYVGPYTSNSVCNKPSPRFQLFAVLVLTAITLGCFLPGINSFFSGAIWQKLAHVLANSGSLSQLSSGCFDSVTSDGGVVGDRPVRLFFYFLFYNTFGLNPLPFHLTSLFLHMLSSILVFYVISRFTEDRLIGLLVAVLFSTHWLSCAAVGYFEGDSEVLKTFFTLATIVAFYKYREGNGQLYYVLSFFAFILSVGSHETSVMLAFVLVCLDAYYKNINVDIPRLLRRPINSIKELRISEFYPHIPFISVSVGYALWLKFYSEAVAMVSYKFTLLNVIEGVRQHIVYLFTLPFVIDSIFLFRTGVAVVVFLTCVYLTCCRKEERTRINLLLLILFILIPLATLRGGINPRYIYLPSIITLTISIILLRECAFRLFSALGLHDKALKSAAYSTCFIFCLVLLPFNYSFLNKNLNYYKNIGEISRSLVNIMKRDFPEGLKGREVAFVNFPRVIEAGLGPNFGLTDVLFFELMRNPLFVIFEGEDLGTVSVSVINIPLPTQAGVQPLILDFYHNLIQEMNASQYDSIAQKPNMKIYFFNSFKREILDVSGYSYKKLHALVREDI